jgi:predicted ATPase/DNA-binding winged helix-turn-helix (wHTH) protein
VSAISPAWQADKVRYVICGFTLDVRRWELRDVQSQRVEIAPLPFRLLLFLIEQRERVVSKEELLDVMWGDAVVNEGSLTQAISIVRRAFGGGEVGAQVIQNVRGRGYRCAAAVERFLEPGTDEARMPSARSSSLRLKLSEEPPSGRSSELFRLNPALESACAGQGAAVLIAGTVGIGKSWLASEALRRMVAHGAFPCELRGYEDQGSPPLWPLRKLALSLLRKAAQAEDQLRLELSGELRMLGPEIAALLPVSPNTPMRTPAEQRFFLFSALVELLERASEQQPLAVLLEDLHWMDEATLLFLERLAPELARMAVLVLGTYRHADATLERVVLALSRNARTVNLSLSGLDAQGASALLSVHGVPAPSPALMERALALTQGNPLFLTQLARLISEQSADAQEDLSRLELPAESRAVLRGQLAALPLGTQRCLELAALLGDDFHLAELQQAAGLSHEVLLRDLAPAYAARLLKHDQVPSWLRRFDHPSVRSAIYESIEEPRRRQLHLAVAEALAHMARDTRPRLSAIAYHYYESAPLGDVDKALHYGLLAARAACEATAYEDAIGHCQRMLEILEIAGHERTRFEVEWTLGQALGFVRAAPEQIGAAYARAAASAERLADGGLHAQAAMSFAGRAPWGITLLRAVGVVEPREIALLETSLRLLGETASPTRGRVLGWLAMALYNSDQSERRAALAYASVAMARTCDDRAALVECLMLAQLSLRSPDLLLARIESLREAAALAQAALLRTYQIDANEELAWALFEAGDADAADLSMQKVMRIAEELGRPQDRRKEARFRVMLMDAAGKFAESEALLDAVRTETAWPPEHPENTAIRTMLVQRLRGNSARNIAELEVMAQRFPLPVAWHCGLVSMYVAVGRMDDARRELTRLRANEFASIPDDHNRVSSYVNLSIACCALQERDACTILRQKLEPYLARNVLVGMRGFYYGPVSRTLGMLDLALGDYDRALARLALAIARDQAMGSAISEAWSRVLYAEADLLRGEPGNRTEVEHEVDRAAALICGLGLAPLEARVERLRGMLGALG